ncbi:MAG TPA: HAD family hydrolase [bacterium]|nr:HAD family hydrolase [bacterium]
MSSDRPASGGEPAGDGRDDAESSRASPPVRIAMWSGPRNISTAMMRSFENRPDTVVWDEPLYAWFLTRTGIDHPMRQEVTASHETNLDVVTRRAAHESLPAGKTVFYQKHMTHHLLPEAPRDWIDGLTNCFLIRDPRLMLASYVRKRARVTAADLGLAQQTELFERERRRAGRVPPVVDSDDVLRDPGGTLGALCAAVRIPFTERMLSWPAGPRDTDGVWGEHWYDAVRASTGFAPWRRRDPELPEELEAIARECAPHYERLREHRLSA